MSQRKFFSQKSVLITGASAGIGAEMARQMAAAGARLTLAARRLDELERVATEIGAGRVQRPVTVACDVSRDGELEGAVAAAVKAWGRLDVVVANAGYGVTGALEELTIEDYRRQFETNVFGVLRTVYAALPELEKTRGNLAIVGSVAGWISTPNAGAYAMSKFALRALADSLTAELRPKGVTVTLLSPGFVVSNFRKVDRQNQFHDQAPDSGTRLHVPTDVAVREMVAAIARGQREKIVTAHGRALVRLKRWLPGLTQRIADRRKPVRPAH